MRLFLIRHGETVDNVRGVYAGTTDSPLTNHGVLQARRLGQHFASHSIIPTRIFSSDLKRAAKTAEAISEASSTSNVIAPSTNETYSSEPQFLSNIAVSTNCTVSNSSNDEAGDDRRDMGGRRRVKVKQCKEIGEQAFGYYEQKPFYARPNPKSKLTGKDAHRLTHRDEPGFVDVESRQSMDERCSAFFEDHLAPIMASLSPEEGGEAEDEETVIAVAHGIILGHLWRAILRRVGPRNVVLGRGVMLENGRDVERLGGWGNTGYLELEISKVNNSEVGRPADRETAVMRQPTGEERKDVKFSNACDAGYRETALADGKTPKRKLEDLQELSSTPTPKVSQFQNPQSGDATLTMPPEIDVVEDVAGEKPSSASLVSPKLDEMPSKTARAEMPVLPGVRIKIVTINSLIHLRGLKKTKGGIGSAKFDEGQKTIESFFKKARTK